MKKTAIFLLVLFTATLCSCTRQYTCECTITGGNTSDFVINATKQSDAAKKCASYSNTSPGNAPSTCALK